MQIRNAQMEDIPQLHALDEERLILIRQSDPRYDGAIIDFAARLRNPDAAIIIGEHDSRLAGFITAWTAASPYVELTADAALIDAMMLDAHQYHAGLGRQLVRAMRDSFAKQNINHISILVPRYHAVEQAFWRALGANKDPEPPQEPTLSTLWMRLP